MGGPLDYTLCARNEMKRPAAELETGSSIVRTSLTSATFEFEEPNVATERYAPVATVHKGEAALEAASAESNAKVITQLLMFE